MDTKLARALAWLQSKGPAMESLLEELVSISSFTGDKAGVDAAGARLRAELRLPCALIGSTEYGDHLVFHAGRPASEGGVLLVGHMDTVFPAEVFSGYRLEGRLARGPGVLDMKGGLVVATYALLALQEASALESTALTFAIVSDEEVGSPESATHLRTLATGARAALVFEAGRKHDAIITQRKGTGAARAVATGRAAHAGNAHADGANAIWALARFIDRAQSLTDYLRGVTVNVGTVRGGIGKNTVPGEAECDVDLRFATVADRDALRASLREAADNVGVAGTRVEITWGAGRTPLERSEANTALYEAYARCQHEAGLGTSEMALVGGGSDASTTAEAGVPSIDGLGPRGEGFHTQNEYVELDSLIPKTEALVRYLLR